MKTSSTNCSRPGSKSNDACPKPHTTPTKPAALIRTDTGFKPTVTIGDISTALSTDRQARIYKLASFSCYAQNAMQTVQVSGVVNI